jgi:hypothetical protein
MASSVYVCQGGCGRLEEDLTKLESRGFVSPKLYCVACIPMIDQYLQERDDLHTKLGRDWANGLSELHRRYALVDDGHPSGVKLPDA